MTVPIKFRKSRERIISFNFNDIADGTGQVKFYGFNSEVGGTADYHLTTDNSIRSILAETQGSAQSGGGGESINLNWDLPSFNLPKTVRGGFLVTGNYAISGAANPGSGTITVKVIRLSGAVETELASVVGPAFVAVDTTANPSKRFVITGTITKTLFKVGDVLRLKVVCTADDLTGGSASCILGNDPTNNDGTVLTPSSDSDETTQLIIYIPFDLDL